MQAEAFQAAEVVGLKDGLAFFARLTREGEGWGRGRRPPGRADGVLGDRRARVAGQRLGIDETQLILERVRGTGGHAGQLACWVAGGDLLVEPPLRSGLERLPEVST